jgi:hypothetical protein
MHMAIKNGWWAAILVVGLAVGCGGSGGSSGGTQNTTGPSPSVKSAGQTANTGGTSLAVTQDAANDALVENGAPGSTTAKTGTKTASASGTTINYQASVSVTVDLGVLNLSGQPVYPNASGQFKVDAAGTVTGNSTGGEITYTVTVTWITDGHFTDPNCGDSATVAAGSNWSYSLLIQWSKTDDLNWSIQATSDVNGSLNATVTSNQKTWTVTGTLTRHASVTFSRTAGNYAFTFSINGQRTVVITDGTETHTVVVTMTALDNITIEVDGVVYGPYTLAQILWWWAFDCKC